MNIDTYTLALIFAILGFGVFLSFRVLNITDLTIEASFGFGAALCGLMCKASHPFIALLVAFIGGMGAGLITALLHTKLKINAILSGILTLTLFYSINIVSVKGQVSISLDKVIFFGNDLGNLFEMLGFVVVIGIVYALFFRTKLGLSIRACGDNEQMTKTQCISTDMMKIIGLMLSNGFVALSGALFVQFQGCYSAYIERGVMVVGVATIIIGEVLTFKKHNMDLMLVCIVGGSIIYRVVFSIVLKLDIDVRLTQAIQASFLILILIGSVIADKIKAKKAINDVYDRVMENEENSSNNENNRVEEVI